MPTFPIGAALEATLLATPTDLASRMQTTFSAAQAASAGVVLRDVSDAIRDLTGMSLVPASGEAVTLDGFGRPEVLLPQWPVTSVASVTVTTYDGAGNAITTSLAEHVDYEWSAAGVLTAATWRASGSSAAGWSSWSSRAVSTVPVWPRRPRSIAVVYDHGPDAAMLATVRGICIEAAARVMANPTGDTTEQIGNYSVGHGGAAGAGVFVEAEIATLRAFRGVKVA